MHKSTRRLAFALSLLASLPTLAKPPDSWGFQDLNSATAKAKELGRPVFLLFGFKGCTWCEYLYRRGMDDADTRVMYQGAVVLAYYDTKAHQDGDLVTLPSGAQMTHKQFITTFSAYPTPSWIFFSPSGAVLSTNRNGKTTTRELQFELKRVLAASRP